MFYSCELMGQVGVPCASGGSLRHGSVSEGGNVHSSRRRQHLPRSAGPSTGGCGSAGDISHSHHPWSEIDALRHFRDTFSGVACEEPCRYDREEALSYAYFQNAVLKWASATASSLGQEGRFSVEERPREMSCHRDACCFQGLKAPEASSQQTWIR